MASRHTPKKAPIIHLPHKFLPRPYQNDLFKAFFYEHKKRIVSIWHRRAGKDKAFLNLMIAAALQRKGTYLYLFPEVNQARRVIWNGIDKAGMRFLDHFPKKLIARTNSTEMLVEFVNGSIFQLGGSDRYDALMGTNPVGIVFSEYSLQNPMGWHYLRPILAENEGWAAFNFTPRGQNHAYELYNVAETNPKWFCQKLSINDTFDQDGNQIITQDIIDDELESGMSEDLIEQEFYCSFSAALPGAYYAKELKRAEENERIKDFPIETTLPCFTFWDLGYHDSTAIWIMQPFQKEMRFIGYYENQGEGLPHYVNYLHDFRAKHNIIYQDHWAPHDIMVHDFSTGKSRLQTACELGINFKVGPRLPPADGIHAVRSIFNLFWFHKTNCHYGLNALRNYHKEYNAKTQTYADSPKHDWSSHGADAMRLCALAWKDSYRDNYQSGPIQNKNWKV